jgi:hypothetical protein
LAGWLTRSLPRLQLGIRTVSAGAREERGLQSGAKKSDCNEMHWSYKAC